MKRSLGLLVACCLAVGGRAAAGEAEDVVDRAVRAHGGADNLARLRQVQRNASGVLVQPGGDVDFTDEVLTDLPDRFRHELTYGPRRGRLVTVLNGDRGWQVTGGGAMPLGKERLAELREEVYVLYLQTLVPLRKDRSFTLAPLPDALVRGRKAAGVKVSREGHEDVRLYFDRGSGLLVKAVRTTSGGGQEAEKEYLFGGHKSFDGLRLPTSQVETLDGRKFSEIKAATYKFPRITEKAFAQP